MEDMGLSEHGLFHAKIWRYCLNGIDGTYLKPPEKNAILMEKHRETVDNSSTQNRGTQVLNNFG